MSKYLSSFVFLVFSLCFPVYFFHSECSLSQGFAHADGHLVVGSLGFCCLVLFFYMSLRVLARWFLHPFWLKCIPLRFAQRLTSWQPSFEPTDLHAALLAV